MSQLVDFILSPAKLISHNGQPWREQYGIIIETVIIELKCTRLLDHLLKKFNVIPVLMLLLTVTEQHQLTYTIESRLTTSEQS